MVYGTWFSESAISFIKTALKSQWNKIQGDIFASLKFAAEEIPRNAKNIGHQTSQRPNRRDRCPDWFK